MDYADAVESVEHKLDGERGQEDPKDLLGHQHAAFVQLLADTVGQSEHVKTQAHAAYRKLDARSRTEAVDEGHALGLIDEFEAPTP